MSFQKGKVVVRKIIDFSNKHPVTRGMATYAISWPVGSLLQQHLEGREKYDYWITARFFLYSSFFVAPTLNLWMTIARQLWPQSTLSAAVTKVFVIKLFFVNLSVVNMYFMIVNFLISILVFF